MGEVKLIAAIQSWLGHTSPPAPTGIGDDCAVIEIQGNTPLLVTTDSLVLNCHFDANLAPELAGQKLVKRNLSDIAAMGGIPKQGVIALMLSSQVSHAWLQGFYHGIKTCADQHHITIIGGDICAVDPLFFGATMTLHGHADRPLVRHGAQQGDAILVSGTLGGSILEKHWAFNPRLEQGQWLAQHSAVTAMMDVTDGLAKDLPALIPKGCQAALNPQAIPVSDAAHRMAQQSEKTPLEHALSDGEDYELLFSLAAQADTASFLQQWRAHFDTPITCIGHFVAAGSRLQAEIIDSTSGQPMVKYTGFSHLQ